MKLIRIFIIGLLAALALPAFAQSYTGPNIDSSNLFPVNEAQPEGGYCLVNQGLVGERRIEATIINATNQTLTARPIKVPARVRCQAATLKHGDTVTMFTTRRDNPLEGRAPTVVYTLGSMYGCSPYAPTKQLICKIVPTVLTIDAVPVPTTPPVVVPPPVVTPPVASATWVPLVPTWTSFNRGAVTVRWGSEKAKWFGEVKVDGYTMCSPASLKLSAEAVALAASTNAAALNLRCELLQPAP